MNKAFYLFATLLLSTLLSYCGSPAHGKDVGKFIVTKVVDGDTFWIKDGSSRGRKIRLIGIDAPESRRTGRKEIGYFGNAAKVFLTDLIMNKYVRLEYDVDKFDQYGRTLAYVYLEDGTFLNKYLIDNGYAVLMTYPPNVKYVEVFTQAQTKARESGKGLWGK